MKDLALNPGTTGSGLAVEAIDSTGPTATDGYAYLASIINDLTMGPAQAIMAKGGLTPNGVTESATASQVVEAMGLIHNSIPGQLTMHNLNDDPAVFGLKTVLLTGQLLLVSAYPELTANQYVGDIANPTALAFYRTNFDDTVRSTTGLYIKLIDARGLSMRATGDAIVNGRTKTGPVNKWDVQEDAFQGHTFNTGQRQLDTNQGAGTADGYLATQVSSGFGLIGAITGDGVNGVPRFGFENQVNSFGFQPAMFID